MGRHWCDLYPFLCYLFIAVMISVLWLFLLLLLLLLRYAVQDVSHKEMPISG